MTVHSEFSDSETDDRPWAWLGLELRIMSVLTLGWKLKALGVEGFPWEEKGLLSAFCLAGTLRFWQGSLEKWLEG